MGAYRISFYLYRSNPIIWREIKIPSEYTARDLIVAFCLGMGISPVGGTLSDEENQSISENTVLKDIFEGQACPGLTAGRCDIFQEQNRREMNSLTFFYELVEKLEENLPGPEILEGTEFHLPQNVFQTGIINEILNGLKDQDSYTLNAIGTFYRGHQVFHKKKTRNLLNSWFLPEKVTMLRTELAVPLPTVLEKKTVNELKALADVHRVYVFNHRKADYVAALDGKLSRIDPYYILQQMSIVEYQSFKKLVLKGELACRDIDELREIFPLLFYYGMISFAKKQGFFLSSEIMDEYGEWYDEEMEIQFRRDKLIASVMTGCRIYYGVITKKTCKTVLNTLYPGEITEEMLDQMWGRAMKYANLTRLSFTQAAEGTEVIAYDETLFNEMEMPLYLKVLSEEYTPRFIPDRNVFENVIQGGIQSLLYAYGELNLFIKSYTYGEYECDSLCMHTINCLRKGYSIPATSKLIVQRLHFMWGSKEALQKKLEEILNKLYPDIPNILLYGYTDHAASEQRIKSIAKIELNRLIKEKEAENQKQKNAKENTTGTKRKKGRSS